MFIIVFVSDRYLIVRLLSFGELERIEGFCLSFVFFEEERFKSDLLNIYDMLNYFTKFYDKFVEVLFVNYIF